MTRFPRYPPHIWVSPPISIHMKHLFSGCHNGNQTQNSDEHVDQQTCSNMVQVWNISDSKNKWTGSNFLLGRLTSESLVFPNTKTIKLKEQPIGCTSRLLTTRVGFSSVSNVDDVAKPQNDSPIPRSTKKATPHTQLLTDGLETQTSSWVPFYIEMFCKGAMYNQNSLTSQLTSNETTAIR